jgi:hypothetical protein
LRFEVRIKIGPSKSLRRGGGPSKYNSDPLPAVRKAIKTQPLLCEEFDSKEHFEIAE